MFKRYLLNIIIRKNVKFLGGKNFIGKMNKL